MQDKKQIYKNGELIREETIERLPKIDWVSFNLGFISMPEVRDIFRNTSDNIDVQVLITVSQTNEDPFFLKLFWNAIIDGLPSPPNQNTIDKLNNLASLTEVPISFDSNCKLIIN